ncbi:MULTISPECIES: chemotaxis protein CheX [Idiomarina]|mgnify:CR=1 FL=1|jgi:chemotaxis protein CheX|uniref:Chemotaxis protein CheX n=2 Tax=Idiomarina baltica TaxID=190892 RepID=A0A348WM07_9GAMM|nr:MULTISPECIES: chemotaxis protein CheX [Idiomarina]MAF76102.1 chemotaxis protein CheX [Idiomarinaceae bacterium]MEC8926197.1 chemotaxis protein CheX [Pseudomonadota bacterium]HAE89829.1 chemotaxis protein CheX [Idiomarina sp.]EAQ30798.1 Chemotaxis protein CheX [Idiomarina baltica OS145]KXS34031.1 MAG: Chemotaxis protein CheX [Idiomarina sp. T82-3]|tara:strand:- start:37 stop:510 length:474 start_codon:yes stop_codon:yes gene_type:complete
MDAAFVNPFLNALQNVLSMMAQIELKPGKPQIKKDEYARGDVSGIIGMVGPQVKGSFSISFEENLACEIMHKMLGELPDSVDEEVCDMVGEITNMVTGGAKKELAERGFEFDMATPIVVSGRDHTISHRSEGAKLIMPFNHVAGKAYIEICFDKLRA